MTVSLLRLDQLHTPNVYDDTLNAAAVAGVEGSAVDLSDVVDGLLSQLKLIQYGTEAGNWFDDPESVGPGVTPDGTLYQLSRRARLEDKLVLKYRLNLQDITVSNAQNWEALDVSGEPPTQVIAIANSAQGAVCAQLVGAVGSHALTENSGLNALRPKNLVQIFDGATGDLIASGGRTVYGLLQVGNLATDGNAFGLVGNDLAQISFVRPNATYNDLEAVPAADIQNKVIVVGFSVRDDLQDCPEETFRGDLEAATGVSGGVSLDAAYDGGVFMEVDGTDVDIRLADTKSWVFRKSGGAALVTVTRNDAGTDELDIGAAIDLFDVNAAVNDFENGIKAATGAQTINVGVTANGVIDSTALDLRATTGDAFLKSIAADVKFQTVRETTPLPLDDSTAGKISALAGGPHASISAAIKHAIESGGIGLTFKTFTAVGNANQGVNIAGATLDLTAFSLDANTPANVDLFLFLNGKLLHGGNVTTKNDVYVGTTPASGDIKVDFPKGIKTGDVFLSIGLQ